MFEIENENTLKESLKTGINLFLGSGFSVMANNHNGEALPVGGQLKQEIIKNFDLHDVGDLSLSQICTILESSKKNLLRRFLVQRFTVETFDSCYNIIDKLLIKSIFTTNIDDLVYKIFSKSKTKYINDITHNGPTYSDRSAIDFIPLHGNILKEDPLVFSTIDIASTFSTDPDKWNFLTNKLQTFPTIFWGYSISDAGVIKALNPNSIKGREQKPKWIVLHEKDEARISYFKSLDFSIIISDTKQLLEYFNSLDLQRSDNGHLRVTDDIKEFQDAIIPEIGTVPVRPLVDFYLGAEPTWHDIFSGQIYKISHYSKIIESINSKQNTAIIGIPCCGKSTLLMMVANDINFSGYKLYFSSLTFERAKLLISRLNGANCLVFLDNFADYIETFTLLVDSPNVIVIGADRDFNFEICSHRIDNSHVKIIDITGLTDKDMQEIFSRIPTKTRVDDFINPPTELSLSPSVFEVIESNIVGPKLKERFNDVLVRLNSENEVLHDLFVMFCYVHKCRTPISFDMTYAFLRNEIKDYKEVNIMVDHLGSLILDYCDSLIELEQDYYIPRSRIVSETVLDLVKPIALKRILLKFHNEISPYRICNYDIFKRRAFDANYAKKAFWEWEEGKEYYEKIYEKDPSSYILQQGALYLAYKFKFNEAFSWIDKAITQTDGKITAIRNSHAIILFKANIKSTSDDDTVRRTLKQSMDILKECYIIDKRKTYHALVFADQAVQYCYKYHDDTAKEYLITAKDMLTSERKNAPWNRKVKNVLIQVAKILDQV